MGHERSIEYWKGRQFMNNKKNAISAILLQATTMVQGLILPRLILSFFGSDVNGLISSITQFLGFISLLEGGLGAVVLAELYRPIEERDESTVRRILESCQAFFNQLTVAFIAYTVILAIIYPLFITRQFSFAYTSSLVLILSITTLTQYLFSITYKLYLQATQKLYIVNYISCVTISVNMISAVVIMMFFPNIHIVKLCSGIVYLFQPLAFRHFIHQKYRLKNSLRARTDKRVLRDRWSGFSQNLAHFINMNTDVVVLTLFTSLDMVSVYTVYMLAISALRGIITSVGNSYQSALGKYLAKEEQEELNVHFYKFEKIFWFLGVVAFSTCLLLINSFVSLYTQGIKDANYFRPSFAAIIVIANMLYVLREPYRLLILAAGKFRETNFGAMMETILNLSISVFLVWRYGLIGVALGTLVAIAYRMLYFIWYLSRHILNKKYRTYAVFVLTTASVLSVNLIVYRTVNLKVLTIVGFCGYGLVVVVLNAVLYLVLYHIYNFLNKQLQRLFR